MTLTLKAGKKIAKNKKARPTESCSCIFCLKQKHRYSRDTNCLEVITVIGITHAVYHCKLILIVIIFKPSKRKQRWLTVAMMAHVVQQNYEYP